MKVARVELIDRPLCLNCLQPNDAGHDCRLPCQVWPMDDYVGKHERREDGGVS